ncbi:T9SS type A sorting domain-containing protein [Neolewinella aurantiaca]|uniref:T9SS type A sorting domain-containing protein n=1 Tax=Neolewinella aurantiaca TaxID=2602767 RepID=A0A5C7FNH3_9BACT|nr:YCF48-related protein [Neolewinella aurantiaca]TXF91775.1 T9SS type A sorting domain-containing protein [Neolewinella aurantiaca]
MKNTPILLFLILLLISFAVTAQTENVVYPRPYDSKLSDVYISDSGEGLAVGSCGVILSTTDAGMNWDLVSDAGGGWDYTTVACPNDDCSKAVIIGDNIILRRQPNGSFTTEIDEMFTDIFVIHHLTGGVLVGDRTFNGYIRSGDGGVTWTEMTLTGTPNQDNRMSFVNNTLTGYSFNTEHELLKTTDGGLTWAPTGFVNTDSHLNMHWRTESLGWVRNGSREPFQRTTDGGQTFTTVPTDLQTRLYFLQSLSDDHLVGLGFVSEVFESTDGGTSWSQISMGNANGTRPNFYGNFHRRGDEFFMPGDGSQVFYSAAGFQDWEGLINDGRGGSGPISFFNDDIGIVTGPTSFIIKTEDGGNTWAPLVTNSPNPNAPVSSIDFRSENEFVLYYGNAYPRITTDGGATFEQYYGEETGISQGESDVFHNYDDGRILVMGRFDYAISNEDQTSWTVNTHGFERTIYDLHFSSPSIGYAVGDKLIAKTTDGGLTWTELPLPEFQQNSIWESVHFYDDNRGMIGRANREGFLTTNGGQTWTTKGAAAAGIYAFDSTSGTTYSVSYETGNNGYLNRSTDLGETWERVSYMCAAGRAIALTPSNQFVFLGGDGAHVEKHRTADLTSTRSTPRAVADLRPFPNPTSGRISLTLPRSSSSTLISVYSAEGRQVTVSTVPAGTEIFDLDLSGRSPGIYYLRWLDAAGAQHTGCFVLR